MKKDVFIVGVKSVFPKLYDTVHVIDKLYSKKFASDRVNKFATRLGVNTQIKNRAISIDLEQFPKKVVALDDSPVVWAKNIIHDISKQSNFPIEFLSVSYNTSSHEIAIPNLSCQIAHACDLNLEIPPQEIANYGCASGIFSIQNAVDFCQKNDALASVVAFEQSSYAFKPIHDEDDENFKASLRTHMLFGDGGAGVLIASEEKAVHFEKKLKIIDVHLGFQYGDVIKMDDGYFFTGDGVKDVMPQLVSDKIIKPMLVKNGLKVEEILEWSLHQGGLPVVESFMDPEILGLSAEQVELSKKMFREYGNISTPSNFIVLEQHFKHGKGKIGDYGMIVGFGGGFYFGAALYQHC